MGQPRASPPLAPKYKQMMYELSCLQLVASLCSALCVRHYLVVTVKSGLPVSFVYTRKASPVEAESRQGGPARRSYKRKLIFTKL